MQKEKKQNEEKQKQTDERRGEDPRSAREQERSRRGPSDYLYRAEGEEGRSRARLRNSSTGEKTEPPARKKERKKRAGVMVMMMRKRMKTNVIANDLKSRWAVVGWAVGQRKRGLQRDRGESRASDSIT